MKFAPTGVYYAKMRRYLPRMPISEVPATGSQEAYADITNEIQKGRNAGEQAVSDNQWETGLALGAGIEYALNSNWIGRVEYQYVNFGTETLFNAEREPGRLREHSAQLGASARRAVANARARKRQQKPPLSRIAVEVSHVFTPFIFKENRFFFEGCISITLGRR